MNLPSHLRIAVSYLKKNRQYTILNVFGLSVGLACFTMIGLWVNDELGYDAFHAKADRTYRVASALADETTSTQQAVTGSAVGPAMLRDFPEVAEAVRIDPSDATVRVNNETFVEDNILITEPAFFSVFDFELVEGNSRTALLEPYSIVLSESTARRYFPDSDPFGKSIRIFRFDPDGNGVDFKVTGIIKDAPHNSHIKYSLLISLATWESFRPISAADGWYNNIFYTYVVLNKDASATSLETKLPLLVNKYMTDDVKGKSNHSFFLQRMTDIHLSSSLMFDYGAGGSMTHVIIFGSVGIIVLLLAGMNYVNLATAHATARRKEVGIQKVMGARKRQLVMQYLIEACVLCFLSLVVAIIWVELARTVFKSMTGVGLYGLYHWETFAILVSITTLVGIAAGFYPSIILSNYNAIAALKGGNVKASGELLRKFLLVTQYAITAVLVSGIVVIQTQLNFVNKHDLGFDQHQVVVFGVHGSPEILRGYNAFANELKNNTSISGITRANTTMGGGVGNSLAHTLHADGKPLSTTVYRLRVDHDYLSTYNIDLIAGRNFSENNPGDSTNAFLVNEAMIHEMGIEDAQLALGHEVTTDGMKGKIIGVTKDFNYDGLHQKIEPMCIWLLSGGFSRVSIKIKGDVKENFATVMTAWKKHFPESPVQYRFLEDTLAGEYESDTRFSKVFLVFSGISLAIACLGLFALVSYNVERRAKEIGIRKVLGASINSIVSLVSKEFLILIGAGLVIALPVAYYFMDQWLMSFAYHVTLKIWMFAIAAVAVLLVAWITIGYRSVVAAATNPTDSLRSE